MGLDITAYRGLTEAVGSEAFDEEGNLRGKYGFDAQASGPAENDTGQPRGRTGRGGFP